MKEYKGTRKSLSVLVTLLLIFASTTALAAVKDTGFYDVKKDVWYAEAVVYCKENSLMNGTKEEIFSPNTTMSRGMLATVLHRIDGSPKTDFENAFSDVFEGTWYADGVNWAAENDIMSGYSGFMFGTDDPVTREQIATALWRYAGSPSAIRRVTFFDGNEISSWAVSAMAWAQEEKVISGKPGNRCDPKGNGTRAEVATILMNYFAKAKEDTKPEPNPIIPDEPKSPDNPKGPDNTNIVVGEDGMIDIKITVGSKDFTAKFRDNPSARAIIEHMPFTLNMGDFASQEKVTELNFLLPSAERETPPAIHTGDIYLWSGNQLVLFYTSFSNTYSYVPVGRITNTSGLNEALGSRNAEVTFSY